MWMVIFLCYFYSLSNFTFLVRGANAGLKVARDFLEPLKKKYGISYGDLWTLAGATAVEMMGGPEVPWRAGRKDLDQAQIKTLPEGRLPNADMGCPTASNSHVRDIFGRMGFNDRETVALLGAHSTGRCHTEGNLSYWCHFYVPSPQFILFFSSFSSFSSSLLISLQRVVTGALGRMPNLLSPMNSSASCSKRNGRPRRLTMVNPGRDLCNSRPLVVPL
jgi:hypothetical protein